MTYPRMEPVRAASGDLADSKGWSTDCITAVLIHPPTIQAMIRWVGILCQEAYWC